MTVEDAVHIKTVAARALSTTPQGGSSAVEMLKVRVTVCAVCVRACVGVSVCMCRWLCLHICLCQVLCGELLNVCCTYRLAFVCAAVLRE